MPTKPHRLFPPFRLDPANAQLWRGEEEITLRPKTFEVLRHLVDHPGQLVTKAELLDAAWTEVAVSDSMPATCVKELRKALGDDARTPRFIETVHRRGYRFIAKVTTAKGREASRVPPGVPEGPKPILVGRDEDLARLKSWYSQVLQGQRRVVFIAGEAGIGKSAFAQAFLDSIAEDTSTRVAWGQCVEHYGAGEPYMPVLEGLTRLGQASDGERVVEILRRLAPTWLAQMPGLLPDERNQLPSEVPGVTQHRMLREMTQAFEALAAESPLVLLLEDLHWSDFSTLELISAIARRVESAQLMILGTYRSVEMLVNDHPLRTMKEELELHRYCEELRLDLLKETDIATYLVQRFSGGDSQRYARFAPVIHARTDGNPLFMIGVVDYLVDEGIVTNSRKLQATDLLTSERLEAPRSIRQMIERNFERLKPEEQVVLEGASVAGAEFSTASVAAALDRPQDEIEACCTRLSRHEQFVSTQGPVTWPDGTVAAGFRFNHALYQEVLYSRLPVGHRLQLHRRIAAREETGYGERSGEVATELAHHYSLANVKNKAIHYFRLAGECAVARGAMVEAEEQYLCALKLLDELPQSSERDHRELELQLAVGSALVATKGWAAVETERAYARAREICDRLDDSPDLPPALFGIWAMYLVRGDVRGANLLARDLIRRAKDTTDSGFKLYAHVALGLTCYFMGDFPSALEHLDLGLSLYDVEQHLALIHRYGFDAGVWCLSYLATTLWYLGYPDQALGRSDQALALAQKLSNPINEAQAQLYKSVLQQFRCDPQPVLERTRSLIALADEHEITVWQDWAGCLCGWALASVGRLQEGIAQINKSRANLAKKGGAGVSLPYFLALLADAFLNANLIDEGEEAATDALDAAAQYDEHHHLAQIHRVFGELLLRRTSPKEIEQAEVHFKQAIEISRAQSAKSLELQATTSLARCLKSRGRSREARTMLAAIYNWFTEGFDTADLKDAKALLDELSLH